MLRFKSSEVEREFLEDAEPKAVALALYADWWSRWARAGQDLLVTDVSRTQAEYDRIYAEAIQRGLYWTDGAGVKHYAGPMPHLVDRSRKLKVRALDLGVQHGSLTAPERLTKAEAVQLTDHLNAHWPRRDGKKTAIFHDVGAGPHVHIQAEIG